MIRVSSVVWVLMVASVGCGPREPVTYPVTGTVRFDDGQPVPFGTVEFESDEGSLNARGVIQRDGSFVLSTFRDGDGAVGGPHRVVVVQLLLTDRPIVHQQAHAKGVAARYANYATSGLTFQVQSRDSNQCDLVVSRSR